MYIIVKSIGSGERRQRIVKRIGRRSDGIDDCSNAQPCLFLQGVPSPVQEWGESVGVWRLSSEEFVPPAGLWCKILGCGSRVTPVRLI